MLDVVDVAMEAYWMVQKKENDVVLFGGVKTKLNENNKNIII
jgi:hypothetical protein